MYLYITIPKVIRRCDDVEGIELETETYKLLQYSDVTTLNETKDTIRKTRYLSVVQRGVGNCDNY